MLQFRQVEAFRAVMQTGSMTGAAEVIQVTQPAVSRMIRDLEREVGFKLFVRRGNVISPTPQAGLLFDEVERSFLGLRALANFAAEVRVGRGGQLRVATLPAMATGFLPRFLARFCRDRPRLRLAVDSLPSAEIREGVARGRFDLGIVAAPFKQRTLILRPFNDAAVVIMPDGHPLAALPRIRARDLRGQDVVVLSKFLYGHHAIQAELATERLGRVFDAPLSSMAGAMAMEGAGLGIIDPFSASEFARQGAVIRPFNPAIAVGTGLIRPADRDLPDAAQEFHDAFAAHVDAFLAQEN